MESPRYRDRLRRRFRESLKVAFTARDNIAVAAIRSAMSAIDNAEAVDASRAPAPKGGTSADIRLGVGAGEAARRELSDQDVLEIVRAEVSERTAVAVEYERLGRVDEASRLRAEANTLASILEATPRKSSRPLSAQKPVVKQDGLGRDGRPTKVLQHALASCLAHPGGQRRVS